MYNFFLNFAVYSYAMKRIFYSVLLIIFFQATHAQDVPVSLEQRLRNNIFLNVYVNKSQCYIGEPVIVTYKLYSSLESVSRVVKNPSFYGFSFRDLVSQGDKVVARETIDGVKFDVHVIRKLQLTAVEGGIFELDPMVITSSIKLLDGNGNKNQVLEGVEEGYILNNGEYNLTISSVPISITVNDLPDTIKAPMYNGPVGDFRMNIQMSKNRFEPLEQGLLTITIVGNGNFDPVKQPIIEWPKGIKVFPSQTQGQFSKGKKNADGYKVFGIPFSGDSPGSFTIMPIRFSYFDAKTNRYNTITNRPITFYVEQPKKSVLAQFKEIFTEGNNRKALLTGGAVIGVLLLLLFLARWRNNKPFKNQAGPVKNFERTPMHAGKIDNLLKPAADALPAGGTLYYSKLKQGVILFFEDKYMLPAAVFNRTSLKQAMTEHGVADEKQVEVINLLTEIEMNIYSGAGIDSNREALLQKTRSLLNSF